MIDHNYLIQLVVSRTMTIFCSPAPFEDSFLPGLIFWDRSKPPADTTWICYELGNPKSKVFSACQNRHDQMQPSLRWLQKKRGKRNVMMILMIRIGAPRVFVDLHWYVGSIWIACMPGRWCCSYLRVAPGPGGAESRYRPILIIIYAAYR